MSEPHSTTSFASPSDTLFASLVIKYKDAVAKELFDDVLALFRHPEFRSDRVTLRESDHIFNTVRIADQEQVTTRSRATERIGAQSRTAHQLLPSPPIPRLVMELLAEYLDANRVPFRYTLREKYDDDVLRPVVCDVHRMLASMSLVCRSWTAVAQRFLRRRIYLDQHTLQSILLGSHLGPWVRELSLQTDRTIRGLLRSFCKVLELCPNITHLHVDCLDFDLADAYVEMEPEGTYLDVLGHIASLNRLEHLWLYQNDRVFTGIRTLRKLFAALRDLRSLKTLGLRRFGEVKESEELRRAGMDFDLTEGTNPSALESLSLVVFSDPGLVSCLLSCNGNHIRRLEMSCLDLDTEFLAEIQSFVRNAVPTQITELQLVDYDDNSDLGFLQEFFPSLRSLSLCTSSSEDGMPPDPIMLPDSVQNFYFYFHDYRLVSPNPDRSVLATLQASQNVRRMVVTYAPIDLDSGDHVQSLFKDTVEYTAMNNVKFTVTKVDGPPHFLDL